MMLSPDHSDARLNLLLSYGGWREGTVVDQLPLLLEPMGIRSIGVGSGEEAAEIIKTAAVHIAMVDMEIPLHRRDDESIVPTAGGSRTLQLLRRLDQPPPTVVVRPPQPERREDMRVLRACLREGAFAVLDRPLALETVLEVMRRILRRYYSDVWPG